MLLLLLPSRNDLVQPNSKTTLSKILGNSVQNVPQIPVSLGKLDYGFRPQIMVEYVETYVGKSTNCLVLSKLKRGRGILN